VILRSSESLCCYRRKSQFGCYLRISGLMKITTSLDVLHTTYLRRVTIYLCMAIQHIIIACQRTVCLRTYLGIINCTALRCMLETGTPSMSLSIILSSPAFCQHSFTTKYCTLHNNMHIKRHIEYLLISISYENCVHILLRRSYR
jgi:hypothetical protein